jgi:hypothetical protein
MGSNARIPAFPPERDAGNIDLMGTINSPGHGVNFPPEQRHETRKGVYSLSLFEELRIEPC